MRINTSKVAGVFLWAVLVTIAYTSSAQKIKIPKERFVKIAMAKLPIAAFPEQSIPVSGITILQQMDDSIRLGFTSAGKDNTVATLTFAKPLSEVLQKQIDRMYRHGYKKDGTQILFVLKKLRYTSRSSFISYQYTKFCADAYVLKGENTLKQVCRIDTVLVSINGGNIGSNFENALRVLLRQTLLNLKEIPDQESREIKFNQIADSKPELISAPILKDTSFREGLYVSFGDFLANTPTVTEFELIENKKTNISIAVVGKNTGKDTLEIWGLSKGGKLFKQYEGVLVPIVKNNESFVIENYDYNTRGDGLPYYKKLTPGMSGLAGFSLVPIAFDIINLVSRSREPKPILVKSLPYIDNEDKQPLATSIDMRTGEFTF